MADLQAAGAVAWPVTERLRSLLSEAAGVPPARGRSAFVRLDTTLGTQTIQRVALEERPELGNSLALLAWPAELKAQAHAFYGDDRPAGLLGLISGDSRWRAEPRPHLAFFHSSPDERLYLTPRLALEDYIARWARGDLDRVRAYRRAELRSDVWPWLVSRGHASPADADGLSEFESRLGRRDVHLRPAVRIRREWPLEVAEELEDRGALVAEVRAALTTLLAALREPPPSGAEELREV